MRLKPYPYDKLPFSGLFKTYVGNFEQLADFYETNPFDFDAIRHRAEFLNFQGDRQQSAVLLEQFNKPFAPDEAVFANIERLKQPGSLAIVTGQQLGLYGGPLYTIFKALTAISLAHRLSRKLDLPVIPVFWLADEDHDYEEVRTISLLEDHDTVAFSLSALKQHPRPASEISLPDEIENLRQEIQSHLIETEFSGELWSLLDACYHSGATFAEAFGRLMTRLFSEYGLVLAGSNEKTIKRHLKEPLVTAVKKADEMHNNLESQSNRIEKQFHRQAEVYHSHLFYLNPQKGRLKIQYENDIWKTAAGKQWTKRELIEEINENPEYFSPDVFLRPILQGRLLPTFGYAAGPGEIAYYGQMKTFYNSFGQQMPVIFPRLSATFIEPAIGRILNELPFEINEYHNRIEDLESEFVERTGEIDIEMIFKNWKEREQSIATEHINDISSIDETLEGAAKNAQSAFFNELNKLKGKVYKSVKKQKNIQLSRIQRIQQNLFPERQLQERTICGIYYMNKFGLDIWARLLDEMDDIRLDEHHLIHL